MNETETTTTNPEPTTAERIARLLEIGRTMAALEAERAGLLEHIDPNDPDVNALASALGLRRKSGRKPATTKKPAPAKKRGGKAATEPAAPPT